MTPTMSRLARWAVPVCALVLLFAAMGGTWQLADAGPAGDEVKAPPPPRKPSGALAGKLNLNTATEDQLIKLPTIGPAKAERIIAWRQKNGGFKRIADLRRVKGFGFKTFKKLEPYLDVKGETTLK
jgi:competence ComEA-like helix-hairpin-helix protein